jgi:hypothetical protein
MTAKFAGTEVRIVTGVYEAQPEDHAIWGDASGGDVVINLPPAAVAFDAASGVGRTFVIRKQCGPHAVVIPAADLPAGCRIDAADTGVVVVSDGQSWWVIARA